VRVGVAHHFGWAVVVTATGDGRVVDRRRVELIEPGLPAAPVHHAGGAHEMHRGAATLTDDELAALVAEVRSSVHRMASRAWADLAATVAEPIRSVSVRDWPRDFPKDIATLRRAPYESRADSVMYCEVLAAAAAGRGWAVHRYDAKRVEQRAADVVGDPSGEVLRRPRATLGTPWTKDHRLALAAAIVAGADEPRAPAPSVGP
jgi:mono/diheme cytochrome c family protein